MSVNVLPGAAPAVPPKVVYISFSAEIIPHTTESLIAVATQCANQKVPEVYLMLSTPGGSVMHGMNLYNVLRAMPFKLTTHNVGNVDSIGNALFLAGTTRYACPHSTFMFLRGAGSPMPSRCGAPSAPSQPAAGRHREAPASTAPAPASVRPEGP